MSQHVSSEGGGVQVAKKQPNSDAFRNSDIAGTSPVVVCGSLLSRSLDMSHCDGTASSSSCRRDYIVYIPCMDDYEYGSVVNMTRDTLPLVMSFHGYGGSMETQTYWTAFAEQYGFVWVGPQGYLRSWNAQQCCGPALEENINDMGFVQAIIHSLEPLISPQHVYGTGHSNGGYMVTSQAAGLFRAIVPMAGMADHLPKQEEPSQHSHVALLLHHSDDDPVVQIAGCCTDPTMPKCCCGISSHSDKCISIPNKVQQWATNINRCNANATTSISLQIPNHITCYTYQDGNCRANTTYCIHQGMGHFARSMPQFPFHEDTADFFAQHACQDTGTWHPSTRSCVSCQQGWSGRHCLKQTGTITKTTTMENNNTMDTQATGISWLIAGVTLVIVVFLVGRKIQTIKKKYKGFAKVFTVELATVP